MSFTARLYDTPVSTPDMRSRTHLPARVGDPQSDLHHVIVHNLSAQGVLIESYHPLEIGADVALDIGGLGELNARILWRDGIFYDCVFDTPLDAERVRAKLTNAKVVWGNFPLHRPANRNANRNDVVRPITFAPETVSPVAASDDRFSPRARVALIVGSATLCWLIPIGTILLSIH